MNSGLSDVLEKRLVIALMQQGFKLLGPDRPAEIIALRLVASTSAQEGELLRSLDAFRDHLQAQAMRQ